jgi:hypothetical protein
LGIPQEYFEQLVYEGEKAWFEGLTFPTLVFQPLNHDIDIMEVSNLIATKLKANTIRRMKIESSYAQMLNTFNQITDQYEQKIIDKSQYALQLINAVTGDTYVKQRKIKNLPCCDKAYEKFLERNYNIDSNFILPFYRFRKNKVIMYNSENIVISANYIPYSIIQQCQRHYEALKESHNYSVTRNYIINNMLIPYQDKINSLPTEVFQTKPDTPEQRMKEIVDKFEILTKKESPFREMFVNFSTYQCVIATLYNLTLTQFPVPIQEPLPAELIFNGKNTFDDLMFKVKIDKLEYNLHFKLQPPDFTRPKNRLVKPKGHLTYETEKDFYKKNLNDKENIAKILSGKSIKYDIAYYRKLPTPYLPEIKPREGITTITQIKNEIITFTRIQEQHHIDYSKYLQILNKRLEAMLSLNSD